MNVVYEVRLFSHRDRFQKALKHEAMHADIFSKYTLEITQQATGIKE